MKRIPRKKIKIVSGACSITDYYPIMRASTTLVSSYAYLGRGDCLHIHIHTNCNPIAKINLCHPFNYFIVHFAIHDDSTPPRRSYSSCSHKQSNFISSSGQFVAFTAHYVKYVATIVKLVYLSILNRYYSQLLTSLKYLLYALFC